MKGVASHSVRVLVDCGKVLGPLQRIWRSIGYDEINWTYTPVGKHVYDEIASLGEESYWVRNHNAFTSGNGLSMPAWGSTNVYQEDEEGNSLYDWSIIDRVYDTYVSHGCKPMIELGFMPHDLSSRPDKGHRRCELSDSWRYPPKDYEKWRELNNQFVKHLIERYGRAEVRTWYFAPWNEPDIGYFYPEVEGEEKVQEYCKVYDYAAEGALEADEKLRFGGPELAGRVEFLEGFLRHCLHEKNYATGEKSSRLDFISFHGKATGPRGRPASREAKVASPSLQVLIHDRAAQCQGVISKFPELKNTPLILNEWDIDVGTIYGLYDYPDYVFRNTSYYPTFLCRLTRYMLDLKAKGEFNVQLFTSWAFYFHGKRCFEGQRTLFTTEGIRKPVFNALEILSKLGKKRLKVITNDEEMDTTEDKGFPTVDGLAALSEEEIQAIVWYQVRNQYEQGSKRVEIQFLNLPDAWKKIKLSHFRIDEKHSNSYTVWRALGSPDYPTPEELALIQSREKLEKYEPDRTMEIEGNTLAIETDMPVHGVSLFLLERLS